MPKSVACAVVALALCTGVSLMVTAPVAASDHADPQVLREPLANITDLFFFPDGDRMIVVFDVRRSLLRGKPFDLGPYEYVIHMDLTTPVTFTDDSERARYGGTIATPDKLHDDVVITLRLNDDTSLKSAVYGGQTPLKHQGQIVVYTGVRDDPFIFPRFFKKNVISMVLSIPMASFPDQQQDFVLWGTALKNGKQIDHVGRSNRTQQGRFDYLNPLPITQQVPAIMREMASRNDLSNTLKRNLFTNQIPSLLVYTVNLRKYDLVADTMIYSNRYPVGFPNGRRLTDDVAALTCAVGDCVLQEISFIEGAWPRATKNDKDFSPMFPYLAEPWPENPQADLPAPDDFAPWVLAKAAVQAARTEIAPLREVPISLIVLGLLLAIVLAIGLWTIVRYLVRLIAGPPHRAAAG